MQPTDLLAQVLPSIGFRFVTIIFPGGKTHQKYFSAGDGDSMYRLASWGSGKRGDAYFSVGAFSASKDGIVKRAAAMSTLHRCLRVDIDCGSGKAHPDKKTAWCAVKKFIAQTGMPIPTLIDSGYGLHAYWSFTQDLPTATWLKLSNRLASALSECGLQVDATTTLDAARILRVPGTYNYKYGAAVLVSVVHAGEPTDALELAKLLIRYRPSSTRVSAVLHKGDINSDLTVGNELPPHHLAGPFKRCAGLAASLATRGKQADEPTWKLTLDFIASSAESCAAKERVARAVSDGHAGFSEQEFIQKWSSVVLQGYQPPTCAKLAAHGFSEHCRSCAFWGKIGSPAMLGREILLPAAAPEVAALRPPSVTPATANSKQVGVFVFVEGEAAVRVADGVLSHGVSIVNNIPHISKRVPQEDGGNKYEAKAIGHYPITKVELLADQMGQGTIALITFHRWMDGDIVVELGPNEQTDTRAFSKQLAAANIRLSSADTKALQDRFMVSFLSELQKIKRSGKLATRNGWTEKNDAFVLGRNLYPAGGSTSEDVRTLMVPEAFDAYHVSGDESKWLEAFKVAMGISGTRQAALALSIGAPLIRFTGIDGIMLNLYSPDSGVGKSTLCDAALSVWGNPRELRRDAKDTANATFKLAAATGHLPFVIDEFTNIEGKQLSDFVYTLTQGRERHRLSSDARLQKNSNRWCLPAIVTSNNSVHDKLLAYRPDAEAESARVFEVRLHKLHLSSEDLSVAKQSLLGLADNYGFLGPRIVRVLLARDPALWRAAIGKRIARWDADMRADSGCRFYSAMCAAAEMGAEIGKILGLPFDVTAIRTALTLAWKLQLSRAASNRTAPEEFPKMFMLENMRNIAVFVGDGANSALVRNGDQFDIGYQYRGEIRGHMLKDRFIPDTVILPIAPLRNFIREQGGNWVAVQEWLSTTEHLQQKASNRPTILAGTKHATRTRCYTLKGSFLSNIRVALAPVADSSSDKRSLDLRGSA